MADEEFEEEEVWSYVRDRRELSPMESRKAKDSTFFSSGSSSNSGTRRLSSASRKIPRNHRQSALVNIPHDWSKIYGHNGNHNDGDAYDGGDDDDDKDDRVPPHEWLAKKIERSQISSFSVCEGAGRTLKGRDQRKVRNAVLTRTGFLE